MAKKEVYPHSDKLAAYSKLISCFPELERKGAAMPYTAVNGNMFSFLDKDGMLGLRLPEKERNEFLKKHKTILCEAHGTVLKEYVLVPDKLFLNTEKIENYFRMSYDYVMALKPKPSKK